MTAASQHDPLHVLREYRGLAPWNLRDLAALVGAVLDASAITPINAAARAQPSERTIRFYVTKGLVSPPEGRGTAATYSYRHFDVLERRAAQALGASLPTPDRLPLQSPGGPPRGRSGRALTAWIARDAVRDLGDPSTWRHIPVGRGIELHVDAAHPLARVGPGDAVVADTVRQALAKLLPHGSA